MKSNQDGSRRWQTSVRLHDMRHSGCTTLLRQGVNPAIVSAMAGHADVGFTLSVYSHADVGMTAVAADALDAAFDGSTSA